MRQINHARKRRQLRYLVKRLKVLLKSDRGAVKLKIEVLARKIKALLKELSGVLAPAYLKKILGSTAFILGMSWGSPVAAQSFSAPQQNPFGLISVSVDEVPTPLVFADLDGDGDMDILVASFMYYSAFEFQYFENIGTPTNPTFDTPQVNPFGLTPELGMSVFPTVADVDGDGDTDILVPNVEGYSYAISFKYFENTGTTTTPQFATAIENPFGLNPNGIEDFLLPAFVDLDGDGDFDLFSESEYSDVFYFENTGTPTDPQYAPQVQNPFGLGATEYYIFPAFADLDSDGDLDLLGGIYANFQYFENTGSATEPMFGVPLENPFGLIATQYYAVPAFADLDGDGDMDLLVAEEYGNFQYFENTTPVGVQEQYSNIPLDIFPNPVIEMLTIKTDTPFEKIEIFDASGRLLRAYDGSVNSIDVSALSKGLHLLKFIDEQRQFTTREIVKE